MAPWSVDTLLHCFGGGIVGAAISLVARTMWNHGSTHIDPPAGAIAVGTLILNLAHGFIK
jgi:hypothetical protein